MRAHCSVRGPNLHVAFRFAFKSIRWRDNASKKKQKRSLNSSVGYECVLGMCVHRFVTVVVTVHEFFRHFRQAVSTQFIRRLCTIRFASMTCCGGPISISHTVTATNRVVAKTCGAHILEMIACSFCSSRREGISVHNICDTPALQRTNTHTYTRTSFTCRHASASRAAPRKRDIRACHAEKG